jgi:hypothetical protein
VPSPASSPSWARRRTRAILVIVVVLLAVPAGVAAQPTIARIAYLSPDSGPSLYSETFRQGLRDLGWVEGQNVAIEYWWADQKREWLPALARELVRRPVDLIFASTTQAALAIRRSRWIRKRNDGTRSSSSSAWSHLLRAAIHYGNRRGFFVKSDGAKGESRRR